ncbi:hypothetical protein K469DRAFT_148046 [Zopfia rhizophila CBS 207.26]|uniref:Fork-head domain-containing protein n=1 Tax=Zopfia rhizophila CBS 207.26 TaxID=1314779 RepID=A0A6A6E6Y9_9PEZI|nr:hypothetical protein K469DRAFT_148046 [Zopfia rhizophila CBS 207.26]
MQHLNSGPLSEHSGHAPAADNGAPNAPDSTNPSIDHTSFAPFNADTTTDHAIDRPVMEAASVDHVAMAPADLSHAEASITHATTQPPATEVAKHNDTPIAPADSSTALAGPLNAPVMAEQNGDLDCGNPNIDGSASAQSLADTNATGQQPAVSGEPYSVDFLHLPGSGPEAVEMANEARDHFVDVYNSLSEGARPVTPQKIMEEHHRRELPKSTVSAQQRMCAFACLRFPDGCYYMTTYAVILGRNIELARRDMRQLAHAEYLNKIGDVKKAESVLRGRKQKRRVHAARSVVSEAGGIVSAPVSALPLEYQQRRQSAASQTKSSSSQHHSNGGPSSQEDSVEHAPQDVLLQSFPQVPEDVDSLVTENPNDVPFLPIHPHHISDLRNRGGPKAISREHARIGFNPETQKWELEVLGQNGLHHQGKYYGPRSVITLDHSDEVMIGLVPFTFKLPDVALTEEQRDMDGWEGSSSRPMSFSFENSRGEVESEYLSDDSVSGHGSVNPRHTYHVVNPFESDEEAIGEDVEDGDDDDEDEDDEPSTPEPRRKKQTLKLNLKKSKLPRPRKEAKKTAPEPAPAKPAAKPPKSKPKEVQKEPQKEKGKGLAKEVAKDKSKEKSEPAKIPKETSPNQSKKPTPGDKEKTQEIDQDDIITEEIAAMHNLPSSLIGLPMEKRKGPGRPPKDGIMSKRQKAQLVKQAKEIEKARAAGIDPADLPTPAPKSKTSRARKDSNLGENGDESEIRETTEKGNGATSPDEKKATKPARPPRTPSPEMKESDYTEEQLQRPSANYVVLIHEAITASPNGQMNLQQIYSAIERKYPYYKFRTQTNGWQSSVRHNLGQHPAFLKTDKEGKGYNWVINPKVSIEKERRKRQASPPQLNQAQRQGYYPPPGGYPTYGPSAAPYYPGNYPPPTTQPTGPTPNAEPALPRLPPSLTRSAPAAAPTSQPGTHASPYASPWAGNSSISSPGNTNPPHPYPTPSSHTPPVTTAGQASGQYGMLLPTSSTAAYNAFTCAPLYGSHYATAGPSPYSSAAGPAYTPHVTAGPCPLDPYSYTAPPPLQSQNQSQTPPTLQNTLQITPQNPGQTSQIQAQNPRGRYPPKTTARQFEVFEAFRATYINKSPSADRADAERTVDNAIQAILRPNDEALKLSENEQRLVNVLKGVPGVIDDSAQINVNTTSGAPENGNDVSITDSKPTTAEKENATSAAAIAASDAAVVAATSLSVSNPATTSTAGPSNPALPQNFVPNMMGTASTSAPAPATYQPSVAAKGSRPTPPPPSYESLTPVVGSPDPAMNGTDTPRPGMKRGFEDISNSEDRDGENGKEEEGPVKKVHVQEAAE